MSGNKINLARIYYPVTVLGPGRRIGIWVNGCDRNCKGCISPELQKYDESKEFSPKEIMRMLERVRKPVDGITISGGEPFERPAALTELVKELVTISDDILIFTGYTINELKEKNEPCIEEILSRISVLVDGPYVHELNDNQGLRGSSNQTIHIFKYPEKYAGADSMQRNLQTIVYGNGVLEIGIPGGK